MMMVSGSGYQISHRPYRETKGRPAWGRDEKTPPLEYLTEQIRRSHPLKEAPSGQGVTRFPRLTQGQQSIVGREIQAHSQPKQAASNNQTYIRRVKPSFGKENPIDRTIDRIKRARRHSNRQGHSLSPVLQPERKQQRPVRVMNRPEKHWEIGKCWRFLRVKNKKSAPQTYQRGQFHQKPTERVIDGRAPPRPSVPSKRDR